VLPLALQLPVILTAYPSQAYDPQRLYFKPALILWLCVPPPGLLIPQTLLWVLDPEARPRRAGPEGICDPGRQGCLSTCECSPHYERV